MLLLVPPKFCVSIVFSFPRDLRQIEDNTQDSRDLRQIENNTYAKFLGFVGKSMPFVWALQVKCNGLLCDCEHGSLVYKSPVRDIIAPPLADTSRSQMERLFYIVTKFQPFISRQPGNSSPKRTLELI